MAWLIPSSSRSGQQVEAAERDEEDKDKSDDELKAEYRKIAERRVRLGLVLCRNWQTF